MYIVLITQTVLTIAVTLRAKTVLLDQLFNVRYGYVMAGRLLSDPMEGQISSK